MNPKTILGLIAGAIVIFVVVVGGSAATYVVEPGHRGVEVMLGKVAQGFKPEGFGFKLPFLTRIVPQLIRQQTAKMTADCYPSELGQVRMAVRVLYRVPESSVVTISRDCAGEPVEALIKPRIAEALKESTARRSAELIVQKREEVKRQALDSARRKVGEALVIEDL